MASHISGRGSPSGGLVLLPLVWAAAGSLEQGQSSASLVLPHPAGDMIRDQTTVLSCWEPLPCPLGSPLLQWSLSPVWQAGSQSLLFPCTRVGLRGGDRWLVLRSNRHLSLLQTRCPCPLSGAPGYTTLSREPWTQSFSTWPSFVLAGGRGPFSRCIYQAEIQRGPKPSALKPTPDNQAHSCRGSSGLGCWTAREAGRR